MCRFVFQLGWSKLPLGFETFWGTFDYLVEDISEKIVLKKSYPECFLIA